MIIPASKTTSWLWKGRGCSQSCSWCFPWLWEHGKDVCVGRAAELGGFTFECLILELSVSGVIYPGSLKTSQRLHEAGTPQ